MAVVQSCRRCQAEVAADAPEGLCPACLLRQVIDARHETEDRSAGRSPSLAFVPPTLAELARHFPQLEILALLGQGGMGAVYKARQTKLDRLVALKVLPPEVARDPAFAERFTREARSLARLNHPQIVTVYDFGDADGLYYFTMEYVDGRNLRDLLQEGPLPAAQARALVLQICDALQYAHDEGLVHRDIKPENILLDRKGRVKIADFGLAKLVGLTPTYLTLTGANEVMGTLLYMAPEQMKQAHSVDHRADLYSLGVILYEMVTGELPLGRFAPPSRKAAVDARLDQVVLKALAREPAERYQDAAALKQDVDAALATVSDGERSRSADARRPGWPCVRFRLINNNGPGGLLRRDEDTLILELESQAKSVWAYFKAFFEGRDLPSEVRIPLHEVATLSYGWGWGKPPCLLQLQVTRLAALANMPGNQQGHMRLFIPYQDRDEARRLVESLGRQDPYREDDLPGGVRGAAQREVAGPGLGLLLGSVLNMLAWVPLFYAMPGGAEIPIVVSVLAPIGLVQALGAILMMRLSRYPLAATAAIVATIPWSPGYFINLPFGIWSCYVLGKPLVAEAFLDHRHSPVAEPVGMPEPRPGAGGRFLSMMRSMGRYILPTTVWREDRNQQ